jgi:putative phage-type endonuclease
MTLSDAQIAMRKNGITATDVAALSGVHPYRGPINVYLDKVGAAPPVVENDRMRWGNLLEPLIRNDYAKRKGLRVVEIGTLAHDINQWAMATPDGVAYVGDTPVGGLEIKTHSVKLAHLYGAPMTDEVPPYVLVQCAWNLYVSGLSKWDVVAFYDNQPHDYVILRDDELIGHLVEMSERFLIDNVRAGVAPDPDGTEMYGKYVAARFPSHKPDYLNADASPGLLQDISDLYRLRQEAAKANSGVEVVEQKIKLAIGEHEGIEWSAPESSGKKKERITWKSGKPVTRVDWAGVSKEALASFTDNRAKELVEKNTSRSAASRVFRVPASWSKEN